MGGGHDKGFVIAIGGEGEVFFSIYFGWIDHVRCGINTVSRCICILYRCACACVCRCVYVCTATTHTHPTTISCVAKNETRLLRLLTYVRTALPLPFPFLFPVPFTCQTDRQTSARAHASLWLQPFREEGGKRKPFFS